MLSYLSILCSLVIVTAAMSGQEDLADVRTRLARLENVMYQTDASLDDSKAKASLRDIGCPPGFKGYGGSCYYFSRHALDWKTAAEECKNLVDGAYIVEIFHAAENDYLQTEVIFLRDSYWIGLTTDALDRHEFVWYTTKASPSFTFWAQDEPSFPYNVNCGSFGKKKSYMWVDKNCNTQQKYICEMPRTV